MGSIHPAFAISVLVPLAFVALALLRAPAVYLLGGHIISRVILDSACEYTYAELGAGLSLMQLYSVAFIGLALVYLLLQRGPIWHAYAMPLAAICVTHLISAMISSSWMGMATALLRWAYLWVLIGLTLKAMEQGSEKSIMAIICVAGLYVFGNQMYSVIAGTPKWGAGQWSYVGTYGHESDISFLFIMLAPAALYFLTLGSQWHGRLIGIGCLAAIAVGMYLAAYRSLWLALAGYLGLYLWNRYLRGSLSSRMLWMSLGMFAGAVLVTTLGPVVAEKMADIGVFVSSPGRYLDFSGDADQVYLMSGRIDLLNSYMAIYLHSGVHVWIAGIGPEQGSAQVGLYAHNEYLSALVETGVFGLLALVWLMARCAKQSLALALSRCQAAQVAAPFFVVAAVSALGTMPFRDMRGMMALGVMLAITSWYFQRPLAPQVHNSSSLPLPLQRPQVLI